MKSAKMVVDKIAYTVVLIVGIFLTVCFGLFAAIGIGDEELSGDGFLPFCIITALIGIGLIAFSAIKRKPINTYKRYMKVLDNNPDASIKEIAVLTNSTEEAVRKNIEIMIAKNYVAQDTFTIKEKKEKKFVTVQCQGCGAKNVVEEGKHQKCEYCGSVLYGE